MSRSVSAAPTDNCIQRKVIHTSVVRRVPAVRDIQLR